MATYNGGQFIRQSISSILAQTLGDFELIIADDCSTDGTGAILASIKDSRVRVLRNSRNLGVVQSRNRCLAEARGGYVAMLDHDDISRPMRLAKQVAYLEEHPRTVLAGTAAHTLEGGVLAPTRHPERTTPILVRWLLHVANPLVCSSVMFRADAVRQLGTFMQETCKYADDYDLYHRLMPLGDIARLDEPLTIYRLHSANTFRRHEATMTANAVNVLAQKYQPWFGNGAAAAASLVVRHLAAGHPVPDAATLIALQAVFERLNVAFAAALPIGAADWASIEAHADALWRRVLRAASSNGVTGGAPSRRMPSGRLLSAGDTARLVLGRLPLKQCVGKRVRQIMHHRSAPPVSAASSHLFGASYEPMAMDAAAPPTLYVVVDTEAEFNWAQPFARGLTGVTAIDAVERGQAVFDGYGLRPIYVVDFPVASQDRSVTQMRAMLDRGSCYVGAHLHPWTTPPFEEQLSNRNSYPGNLPPELEEQKLACLLDTIRARFGVPAVFYKAGRYGFGQATAGALARYGIKVDFSILPGADLTGGGGPNFHGLQAVPYRVDGGALLAVPMTRSEVGLMPWAGCISKAVQRVPGLGWLRMQPVLSRLRIADTLTLTPEGVTAGEQIRLIKAMLRRGNRLFVLHYHSPSLSPGHTPYVQTAEDSDRFLQNIRDVCRFFFEDVGGMPGYPPDLLDMANANLA